METILIFIGVGLAVAVLIGLVLIGFDEAEKSGGYVRSVIDDHNEGR
jgi:ABC-type uncharacterized transport system permease subunit